MSIKIYTAGGSVDKRYSTQASAFVVGPPAVAGILGEANVTVGYEVEPLIRKDSLDMTDEDRALLVERVKKDDHGQILITHGTDTMVETGRALAGIPGKTIVITGAMRPAAFRDSDASFNVGSGFLAVQLLPPGVYLVINGRVFDPATTSKNVSKDRFEARSDRGAE